MSEKNFSPFKMAQKQDGFTLVEILIAIVLLSFLMIGVYTITDNSTTTIERVSKEDSDFAQVGTALNRLEMDFSQLYSPLYYSALKISKNDPKNPYARRSTSENKFFPSYTESGHPVPLIEQPSAQELIFFTSSNRKKVPNSKESNYSWIYYKLRSMPVSDDDQYAQTQRKGDNQLIRKSIATNPYNDSFDWDKTRAQPILNYVKDFKILFWSTKKEKFVESLSDLENKLLIRAIKIVINRFDVNNQPDQIIKIIRPLWPNFDTTLDQKKSTTSKPNTSGDDD